MKNQIYRLELSEGTIAEFSVIDDTSADEPYYKTRSLSLAVQGKENLDEYEIFNAEELESLIDFLQDAQRHINKFNSESEKKSQETQTA